jgi:pyruvate kinase
VAHLSAADVDSLIHSLEGLRQEALLAEAALVPASVAERHRPSAANLAHYLGLRRRDLRSLQRRLAESGLSSLGRTEAHVLAGIDGVLDILHRLRGDALSRPEAPLGFERGERLLSQNAERLLGSSGERHGRIMVTMPSEAATDPQLVESLVKSGMDVMRVNCAHDDADAWGRMAENLAQARLRAGRPCALYADLAGPKLRATWRRARPLHIEIGETLLLVDGPGDEDSPPPRRIGCTLPEAVAAIRPGHRVYFDDGKVTCHALARTPRGVLLQVDSASSERPKIKPDAGINLPDTTLDLGSLTRKDLLDLDFVVRRADIVGLSFVRRAADVHELLRELEARDAKHLGVVLKIETGEAFDNLPQLLLALLAADRCGIMVARGDLAVEVGFERLAEVQEEILWICEAAHVPVIWATQVLESLAKKGIPTRAEVTDAAMAVRAECVMLNKGPHITEAVSFLDGVLRRMQDHQSKRRTLLRRLSVASAALPPP